MLEEVKVHFIFQFKIILLAQIYPYCKRANLKSGFDFKEELLSINQPSLQEGL